MENLIFVVIFLPLLTAIGIQIISKLVNELLLNFLTINSALLSFTLASGMFAFLLMNKFEPIHLEFFTWIPNPEILFEFTLDGLSGIMMILVTGLSVVIQIFSTSYMSKDENYSRYFVYFNVFVFSMLLLVMSGNFLVMFFGWELVGLSSYLLISFWSKKQSAAKAGNKAFICHITECRTHHRIVFRDTQGLQCEI